MTARVTAEMTAEMTAPANAATAAREGMRTDAADDGALHSRRHVAEAWMQAIRKRAEAALDRALPPATTLPTRLHEAMRYATLGGGKRVRAMLVYAAAEWARERAISAIDESAASSSIASSASSSASSSAFSSSDSSCLPIDAAAAAVELMHAYSLVHDDLPCMDDDDLRRGRPTVHVAFDEATALLVGDALQALAFEVLATALPASAAATHCVALLAAASGSRGMAGGQAIDLESVGKQLAWPELEAMHRAKTGALLRAAVLLGASAARSLDAALDPLDDRERAALDDFCGAIGLAFQVVDDVLDVETDSATLGKTAGKDAMNGKPTVVTALGISEARALARRLRDDADRALDRLGGNIDRLRDVADFITGRSF